MFLEIIIQLFGLCQGHFGEELMAAIDLCAVSIYFDVYDSVEHTN